MKGKKSPIIMGLVGAMLLSTGAFAATPSDFSDFPTDWSAPAMTRAVENGLLNGSDGKILPKGLLTRAQMATMVNRAFASSAKASLTNFTDMVPGAWHYDEMAKAVQMGVFQGADGKLSPNDPITREQAFAVLARAFGLADGKTSSLDKFSDGAQVSSWAKGAVAALVEQGYVKGADGALNPQSYITRAEFAQVMDALVAAYADKDLKDQTVEGNLILRTNSTLENVTVNGDLILSDGVSAANLKNVTVTGRIVVRGGSDKIALTKTTAKNGIQLANPNGKPNVTVDGKAYDPNGTNNGGSTSDGSTSGGSSSGGSSSSSGGNSSTKPDLVMAGQTKLVNVDWGQYVAVRFTSGNSLDNCTLTVDGTEINGACSKVTTDGSIVKWEATTYNPAKLVITKGSQTQTVTLSNNANATKPEAGSVAGDYYFLANGPVYVWDYHLTNYDAAGKVRVAPKATTFSLTNEEQDAIKFYSPDAILTRDEHASNLYKVSGTVELMFNYANGTDAEKAWVDGIKDVDLVSANENNTNLNTDLNWTLNKEYEHGTGTVACITVPLGQSNFYSNGRYQLRVTSNGTSKLFPIHVVNKVVPTLSATSAHVTSNDSRVYFEVENMLYGITQPIYRVDLTDPKHDTKTLTKIDDWYLIGDTFVLYNDKEDTNLFPYSGNYTVTIYADGFQKFSKTFEVTGGEAPTIQRAALPYGVDTYSGSSLSGGSASSGSGSEGGSNTMNAYIVFDADLLANANIMTALNTGNEYASAIAERWNELSHVDVYAKGSSDVYTYVGYVNAVSDAHVNGENLTFAAYAEKETAKKDFGRPYAVKQVLEDNLLGETTTFSETSNKAAPDIVLVKAVEKEDNTIEYVSVSEVTEGKDAVFKCNDKAYLKALEAGTVKSTSNYPAFEKDTDYTIDTEKGLITIKQNKLTLGQNNITLTVDGYQTARLSFNYQKVLEEVKLSAPTEAVELGNPVTITCNAEHHKNGVCDFFASVTSVELTGPDGKTKTVLPKGQEGSDLGYEVSNNTLVLCKNQFADTWKENAVGKYTLTLKAGYGYAAQTVEFEIKAATPETPETPSEGNKDVPAYVSWKLDRAPYGNTGLCFGANGENSDVVKPYLEAIKEVKLNDTPLAPVSSSFSLETGKYYVNSSSFQTVYFDAIDFSTENSTTITIIAEGYKDFTLVIGADGNVVTGGDSGTTDPVTPPETETKSAPTVAGVEKLDADNAYRVTFEDMDGATLKAYLENISSVKVGDHQYNKAIIWWDVELSYKLDVVDDSNGLYEYDSLKLTTDGFSTEGNTVVTVKAKDYADLTFTVDKNGNLVTDSNAGGDAGTTTPGDGGETTNKAAVPGYRDWNSFGYQMTMDESGNSEVTTYLNAITNVTVGNKECEAVMSSSSLATGKYYVAKGSSQYIKFYSGDFSGETQVKIEASGYEDFIFTINNRGNLITE